ncbi:MAG TPA: hypothetical protein DEP53_08085 [Bacteroidetes bacterium]|nr:hypothetical protein [Bacteroidota bacterium]
MSEEVKRCLHCEQTEQQIPLLTLQFMGGQIWICPQCLPVLIHAPQKLAGKIPGAEKFSGAEHHH